MNAGYSRDQSGGDRHLNKAQMPAENSAGHFEAGPSAAGSELRGEALRDFTVHEPQSAGRVNKRQVRVKRSGRLSHKAAPPPRAQRTTRDAVDDVELRCIWEQFPD